MAKTTWVAAQGPLQFSAILVLAHTTSAAPLSEIGPTNLHPHSPIACTCQDTAFPYAHVSESSFHLLFAFLTSAPSQTPIFRSVEVVEQPRPGCPQGKIIGLPLTGYVSSVTSCPRHMLQLVCFHFSFFPRGYCAVLWLSHLQWLHRLLLWVWALLVVTAYGPRQKGFLHVLWVSIARNFGVNLYLKTTALPQEQRKRPKTPKLTTTVSSTCPHVLLLEIYVDSG